MDEEINGNLLTGIVVAGIGMVLFILFAAFWQLSVLVMAVVVGWGVYKLVKSGKLSNLKLSKPKLSRPRMPSLPKRRSRPKQPTS